MSKNQGYIFKYNEDERVIFRLSGTGSSGATIRIYLERRSDDTSIKVEDALKEMSDNALMLS